MKWKPKDFHYQSQFKISIKKECFHVRLPFIKFEPNIYVLKYRNGKIVKQGAGLSFFYYAPTTSLVAVTTSSIECPFIFEEVTSDFQEITIQGL